MRAAEGGKKVIQRVLVGDVDGRHVEVHLVAIGVEEVVLADGGVEKVPRRNALRVLIVVSRIWSRDADQTRRKLGS